MKRLALVSAALAVAECARRGAWMLWPIGVTFYRCFTAEDNDCDYMA